MNNTCNKQIPQDMVDQTYHCVLVANKTHIIGPLYDIIIGHWS